MNRREFLENLAKGVLAIGVAPSLVSLVGCSKKEDTTPRDISISGKNYTVSNGVISQTSDDKEKRLKLGVLADTHSHSENTKYFTEQLVREGANAFLLAGDLSWSFGDYEGSRDDYNEIISVVEPVAQTGKLTLVYPGNHEQRKAYSDALETLTRDYSNVVDMERVAVADLSGATIVGLGGNDNPRFNVPEGYLRNKSDFDKLGELAREYQGDKPLLIATHIPKKYSTQNGLDVVENGKMNVGGINLARIRKMLNSKFGVSGHIHEAYGIITPDEQPVKNGELIDELDFNPGAVFDHLKRPYLKPAAGLLEFRDNKARVYILTR